MSKRFQIGLQLYSVRDEMQKDVASTLRAVADMGYDGVEFAGYFGRTAGQLRSWLDEYGLTCFSAHQSYDVFLHNPQPHIAFLQTLGASWCVIPWMGLERHACAGEAVFAQTVADIRQAALSLRAAGIGLLYHNHDFEFGKLDGRYLLDILYDALPAPLLQTELDTAWARYVGVDPAALVRRYAGRSPLVHLKDFTCSGSLSEPVYALIDSEGRAEKREGAADFRFRPLGEGVQDFPALLTACEDAGTRVLVVEQDESPDLPPLEAAKRSRAYLKSLGV